MSRGRRDVRRSFTTLLVLGSMMMTLLVFSLLTKIRPVSLANAPQHAAARNAATRLKAKRGRNMGRGGTKASLYLRLQRWLPPAYDLSKRRGKTRAERPRRAADTTCRAPGGNVADGRTLARGKHRACPAV